MDRRNFLTSAVVGTSGVIVGGAVLSAEKPSVETEVENRTGHPITVVLPPVQPGATIVVTNHGNNSLTVKQSI